ncbi:major facilitator superfamily transporter multidrug resistance [Bisporella sp. PMI_857]|nr:major facilitator superfamily transporter multidrug resistance [Bisporella sp. PMI_857]
MEETRLPVSTSSSTALFRTGTGAKASGVAGISSEEKQDSQAPSIDFVVEWEGENDPLCPRSMSLLRRWITVCVLSMGSLLVTCASSLYASAYDQLKAEFHCSQEIATLGLSLFVVGLALGPMLLSPLSEFYGRRPIYIVSMFFFLIWLIPSAVAQNIQTMLVGRFFDGFAGSAFLSVAAGTVSDLFAGPQLQEPMMLYTIAPFLGPVIGPAIGGFINDFTNWRWSFYALIIWTFVMLNSVLIVPETYHPKLLAFKAAEIRRLTGNEAYHSKSEIAVAEKSIKSTMLHSLYKPFELLIFEPMCLSLCLYSALLLGILYLFFGAFPLVFRTNHNFSLWESGLTFLGLVVGFVAAIFMNPIWHKNYLRLVEKSNSNAEKRDQNRRPDPEFRLPPAILGGVLVPVGLFWFGWTTYRNVHWIVPIIGSVFFGTGMLLVFSGIFTFLVDAYPAYAASALAANTFTRCMFAGAFLLFGNQMYKKLGYQWATSLLAFLALAVMPFPYLFFRYGKSIRSRSRFATA